jgi:hypothetical protein
LRRWIEKLGAWNSAVEVKTSVVDINAAVEFNAAVKPHVTGHVTGAVRIEYKTFWYLNTTLVPEN